MPDTPESQEPATGRLSWLAPVAAQIAAETGLPYSDDIEDIVIIAFEGLLNDPTTRGQISYQALVHNARREAARWTQERHATEPA